MNSYICFINKRAKESMNYIIGRSFVFIIGYLRKSVNKEVYYMKNRYRISMMILIIVMYIMYMTKVIKITEVTNFSVSLAVLLLSISTAIDTFSQKNKLADTIMYILEVVSFGVMVIIPSLKNEKIVKEIMNMFDSNVLLLLSLFFTLAGQWSAEIKIREIKINEEKKNVHK